MMIQRVDSSIIHGLIGLPALIDEDRNLRFAGDAPLCGVILFDRFDCSREDGHPGMHAAHCFITGSWKVGCVERCITAEDVAKAKEDIATILQRL